MKKIIAIDIDGVITLEDLGADFDKAVPNPEAIRLINKLYDEGNTIVLWTARGKFRHKDVWNITKQQLHRWGVKYHILNIDKPTYDVIIDDKAFNSVKKYVEKRGSPEEV